MIAQIKRWCAHPNMRPNGSKKTKVVGIKEELFSEKLRTRVRRIIKTVFCKKIIKLTWVCLLFLCSASRRRNAHHGYDHSVAPALPLQSDQLHGGALGRDDAARCNALRSADACGPRLRREDGRLEGVLARMKKAIKHRGLNWTAHFFTSYRCFTTSWCKCVMGFGTCCTFWFRLALRRVKTNGGFGSTRKLSTTALFIKNIAFHTSVRSRRYSLHHFLTHVIDSFKALGYR